MKKIICIGECSLDIIFDSGSNPVGSMPGGRIANAAALLAREGLPVIMVSEASNDPVGDMVVNFLKDAGVDITSVDRFTEGRTPVTLYAPGADGLMTATRYENYTDDCFDVVWPRIDEGDIVVYGGYYSLDQRMRRRMSQLLHHCQERKAVSIYLPGFMPQQEPRITRVMPSILENLEMASIVMSRNRDLSMIFGTESGDVCYQNHIDFYCRSLINIDTACHQLEYFSGKEVTAVEIPAVQCSSLMWNAGTLAGVVKALCKLNATAAMFETPGDDIRKEVLSQAATTAHSTVNALEHDWQKQH